MEIQAQPWFPLGNVERVKSGGGEGVSFLGVFEGKLYLPKKGY